MAREVVTQEVQGRAFRVFKTLNNGRYEFERVLASGGQGVTLIARDTRLAGNRVLIKAPLHGDSLAKGRYTFNKDKTGRHNQILYEVTVMGGLTMRLQNVPRLISYFYDDNASLLGPYRFGADTWRIDVESQEARDLYLVYEFLSAGRGSRAVTLEDVIEQEGRPLPERYALEMARQIAGVLVELHERDKEDDGEYYYVYQDMKPANILVTGERYFFLIDFGGLVKASLPDPKSNRTVIQYPTGAVTVGYAPPEAFDEDAKRHIDQRFDIYGLGATLFHALSGVHPVQLLDNPENLYSAADFSTRRIAEKAPDYRPSRLAHQIVERATRPDPRDRYASIQRMLTDILGALGED